MRVNGLRAIITAWLIASQRSLVGTAVSRFARVCGLRV